MEQITLAQIAEGLPKVAPYVAAVLLLLNVMAGLAMPPTGHYFYVRQAVELMGRLFTAAVVFVASAWTTSSIRELAPYSDAIAWGLTLLAFAQLSAQLIFSARRYPAVSKVRTVKANALGYVKALKDVKLTADQAKTMPAALPAFASFYAEAFPVKLDDEIDRRTASRFVERKHKKVLIEINCSGGMSVYAQQMYTAIRLLLKDPSRDVRVLASGLCGSAAVLVFLAVPAEARYGSSQVRFAMHSTRQGYATRDDATPEELKTIDWYNKQTTEDVVIEATRISAKSIHQLLQTTQDYFFGPLEALELGMISEIID